MEEEKDQHSLYQILLRVGSSLQIDASTEKLAHDLLDQFLNSPDSAVDTAQKGIQEIRKIFARGTSVHRFESSGSYRQARPVEPCKPARNFSCDKSNRWQYIVTILSSRSIDNIKHFLEALNLAQKHLALSQKVEHEIRCAKVPFCHIHIFYSKFLSIFKNIQFSNKSLFQAEVDDYTDQLRSTAWLIFVILSSL